MPSPDMSDPRVTVRPATPDDAATIATIRVLGWQTAYRGQLDDALLDEMSAEGDEPRWRAHLSAPPPGHRAFVAERGERPVGFVTCGPSRDAETGREVAEIYAIYVHPDVLGTGVGRALLERATSALRADRYREAVLWVLETNVGGHRFYEAAGWRTDGAAKEDELDRFDVREIRYRRALD